MPSPVLLLNLVAVSQTVWAQVGLIVKIHNAPAHCHVTVSGWYAITTYLKSQSPSFPLPIHYYPHDA